jgi:hypothetical protein
VNALIFTGANVEDTLICLGIFLSCEPLRNAGWIADSICGPVRFCTARGSGHSNPDGVREDVSGNEDELLSLRS